MIEEFITTPALSFPKLKLIGAKESKFRPTGPASSDAFDTTGTGTTSTDAFDTTGTTPSATSDRAGTAPTDAVAVSLAALVRGTLEIVGVTFTAAATGTGTLETAGATFTAAVTRTGTLDAAGVTFTGAVTGVFNPTGVTSTFGLNAVTFPVAVPDTLDSVGTVDAAFDRGGVVVPATTTGSAFTGGDTTFWIKPVSITFTDENHEMERLRRIR